MKRITLALVLAWHFANGTFAQTLPQDQAPPQPRYTFRQIHDPYGTGKFYLGREIAHVMSYEGAGWLERPEREREERVSKLLPSLDIKPGQTVADLGAGSGFHTVKLSKAVGDKGKVYAVDIQKEMIAILQKRIKQGKFKNIIPILNTEKDPKLPANAIDMILMVDVYHELSFPYEVTIELVKSLKVGGRLVFVEYRLEDPKVPILTVHRMSIAQVKKEMALHPQMKHVKTLNHLPWQHVIIFEKVAQKKKNAVADLPANTWVELKYTTEQPADKREQGRWVSAGWNKLVYDPDGKRVLFYDRWYDTKHGGTTIYGNCLFALDPANARLTPLKIDNWKKVDTKTGGYRTIQLAENDKEPTPASRHVYHAFEYVSEFKAVYLCNGANQGIMIGEKHVAHDACDGAWRFDLKSKKWAQIKSANCPRNRLDESMAYCPDIKSMVYSSGDGQVWILDLMKNAWRKAKNSPPPRTRFGRTVCYDPVNKRMLLAGGGRLDAWQKGEAREFRELYAFDPKTETVERLADAPTALYESQLAFDSRRQTFLTVAVFNKQEQPSGMFSYDPKKDLWKEIKPASRIPPHRSWHGWMKLCYAADHDCFIGTIGDRVFAYRPK
ncbi:MAG: methyltransferase domain-containing protein [Planctomycetes bacterium]|nr:methyltransferase domain-containing protein [Planctomycetota bacterium]